MSNSGKNFGALGFLFALLVYPAILALITFIIPIQNVGHFWFRSASYLLGVSFIAKALSWWLDLHWFQALNTDPNITKTFQGLQRGHTTNTARDTLILGVIVFVATEALIMLSSDWVSTLYVTGGFILYFLLSVILFILLAVVSFIRLFMGKTEKGIKKGGFLLSDLDKQEAEGEFSNELTVQKEVPHLASSSSIKESILAEKEEKSMKSKKPQAPSLADLEKEMQAEEDKKWEEQQVARRALLETKKSPAPDGSKLCPVCQKPNPANAVKCIYCHSNFL